MCCAQLLYVCCALLHVLCSLTLSVLCAAGCMPAVLCAAAVCLIKLSGLGLRGEYGLCMLYIWVCVYNAMYIHHAAAALLLPQVVLLCRHRRRYQKSHWSSAWSSWGGESVITVIVTVTVM
jgi:hypothetical protein